MNKNRQAVWDKSNGICWYCGDKLVKGWHVDHFLPIVRDEKGGGCMLPENDTFENLVPSCAPCNRYKTFYNIEYFRHLIQNAANASRKLTSGFRISERFGLIEVKDEPVVFWFEKRVHRAGLIS